MNILDCYYNVTAKTNLVKNLMAEECGVKYTHLNAETPANKKMTDKDPNWLKPRGVPQRNEGLHWLRQHLREQRNHPGNPLNTNSICK